MQAPGCVQVDDIVRRASAGTGATAPVIGGFGVATPTSSGPGGQMSDSEIWATGRYLLYEADVFTPFGYKRFLLLPFAIGKNLAVVKQKVVAHHHGKRLFDDMIYIIAFKATLRQ